MEPKSCRVCLLSEKKLISLYKTDKDELIVDLLSFCMSVPILKDDNLPQCICVSCLSRLKKFHHLKTIFLKNDEHLKRLLKNSPLLKTESDIFEEVEVKCEPMEMEHFEDDSNDSIKLEEQNDYQPELDGLYDPSAALIEDEDWKPAFKTYKIKVAKKMTMKRESADTKELKCHICYICDLKFANNRKKNDHIAEIHEKEASHICTICAYICAGGKLLDTHMQVHKEEASFFCEFCAKPFFKINNLKKHVQLVHEENEKFECDQCGIKIKSIQALKKHKLFTHGGHRLVCDTCGLPFRSKDTLAVHMAKSHGAEARIKCDSCKNPFNTNGSLRRHQEKYKGTCATKFVSRIKHQKFPCPHCPKIFHKRSNEFTRHVNSHTNNRPYKCDKCQKGFFARNVLIVHKKGCDNLRQFKCQYCERGFNRRQVLEIHERSHTGETPFKCQVCPKSFTSQKYVYRHMKEIHNFYTPAEKGRKKPVPVEIVTVIPPDV